MGSPNQSRHCVAHKSGRQVLEASKESLMKNGLTYEQYALTKGVGHVAAATVQEVGSVDPLSELAAGGHLGSALLLAALIQHDGLAQDIDWVAISQTANAIAGTVGSDAAAEIAQQRTRSTILIDCPDTTGLRVVPDRNI